jgi:hypothetical protein
VLAITLSANSAARADPQNRSIVNLTPPVSLVAGQSLSVDYDILPTIYPIGNGPWTEGFFTFLTLDRFGNIAFTVDFFARSHDLLGSFHTDPFCCSDGIGVSVTVPFTTPTHEPVGTVIMTLTEGTITNINELFVLLGPFIIAPPVPTVPEPSTWAMMLIGFAGLGFAAHRRSRKSVGGFAALA